MIDVVFPYTASHNGEKIRYTLRSIHAYFPQLGEVCLAGERPHWFRGKYVSTNRNPNHVLDTANKILAALPEVSEDFVIWDVNSFLMQPTVYNDFANQAPINAAMNSPILKQTLNLFDDPKIYNPAAPLGVNRDKLLALNEKYDFARKPHSLVNLYLNEYGSTGDRLRVYTVDRNIHFTQINANLKDSQILYCPAWYKGLKGFLQKRFDTQTTSEVETAARPKPKISQVRSLTKALLSAKEVPLTVMQDRLETCLTCDKVKADKKTKFCGLCGCSVSSDENKIVNLARYEENLPEWGCKHPERRNGYGWKN